MNMRWQQQLESERYERAYQLYCKARDRQPFTKEDLLDLRYELGLSTHDKHLTGATHENR